MKKNSVKESVKESVKTVLRTILKIVLIKIEVEKENSVFSNKKVYWEKLFSCESFLQILFYQYFPVTVFYFIQLYVF